MPVEFDIEEKSLKNIKQKFKEQGVYYSSHEMAEKLKSYLPTDISEVYDPTCGAGGLLAVFPDNVKKYGQELDPSQVQIAQENLVNSEIVEGNTLTNPAFLGKKFKAITANYPFSTKWTPAIDKRFEMLPCLPPKSKADFTFIFHILYYLSDDGKAVVLCPHGVLFRGNAEEKLRKYLIDQNYIERLIAFPAKLFVDTSIPTVALVLSKSKTTTDIYFEDTSLKKGRSVPLEEIQKNDYNLNFPRYVFKEEVKEPVKLDLSLKQWIDGICEDLKATLEMGKVIAELRSDGGKGKSILNYKYMLKRIKQVITEAEADVYAKQSGNLFEG